MEDLGALRREGSRKEGGFGVWGRRVWGLAVPSNTKTLGGLRAQGEPPCSSPSPGAGPAPSRGDPELQREKPARSRANQSREEPVGTAKSRDRNSPRQKSKKVTLRKLKKSNNVLPPKSTGGALALGPKAGTEKWRGRGGGSARALPSHPPGTGSGLKET